MSDELNTQVKAVDNVGGEGVTKTFQRVALPFAIGYSLLLMVLISLQQMKFVSIDTATIELLIMIAAPWIIFAGIFVAVKIPFLGTTLELGKQVAATNARVDETKDRVDATKQEVERTNARLDRLYAYAMNNELYWHLKKLSGKDPGTSDSSHVFVPYDNNSGLCAELSYLKLLNHIAFSERMNNTKKVRGVGDLPKGNQSWGVLRHYIQVTDNGLEHLTFREDIMKEDARAKVSNTPPADGERNAGKAAA